MNSLISRIVAFGWLRLSLLALAVLAMFLAPEPEARTVATWPLIVPTLLAPAIAPLIFMVVMLDLLMAKVMSSGEQDTAKLARARRIMLANALAATGIAYMYVPFFLALGR